MATIRYKIIAFLLLLGALHLVASCSDDGPLFEIPEDQISSPDELVDAFISAVEARDIESLVPLFDHDTKHFSMKFREEDVAEMSLPTGYLNMGDMIQVWRNILSGQEILNNEEDLVPAVIGIEVIRFDRNTDWCGNECGTESWLELRYNIQRVNFRIEFTITRSDDQPPLFINGNLEVKVRPPCSDAPFGDGCEGYALFGIEDGSWDLDREGSVTFGEFAYQYFTNEAPEVVLTVGAYEDHPLRVDGIACESRDSGLPMRVGSYRWRTDPEGTWSVEDDQCFRGFSFSDYGEKMIEVEVTDHWGLSTRAQVIFELNPSNGAMPD